MAAVKNKSSKIALCAVVSALAVALMLLAKVVSVADYSITALCGLVIGVIVIECGIKWALASYAVISLLGVLLAPGECSILFVAFFGYYSVIKIYFDKLPKIVGWILKLALFNVVVISVFYVIDALVAPVIDIDFLSPLVSIILLLALANLVFILYDTLFNRLMSLYWVKVHSKISKYIK